MGNLLPTLLVAVLLMGLVVLGLSVGWLVTGKNRLSPGCGRVPKEKKGTPCRKKSPSSSSEHPSSPCACGREKSCSKKP